MKILAVEKRIKKNRKIQIYLCKVLPRPVSSAKMQPRYGGNNLPATQSNTNCTPILWCGRNQFAKMYGTWTSVTAEGDRRSSEGRVDWDVNQWQ